MNVGMSRARDHCVIVAPPGALRRGSGAAVHRSGGPGARGGAGRGDQPPCQEEDRALGGAVWITPPVAAKGA